MRNLLAFAAATVITFLAVGWYLDWYKIRSRPGRDGSSRVTVDINTKKISTDLKKAETKIERKIQQKIEEKNNKAQASAATAPPSSPVPAAPMKGAEPGLDSHRRHLPRPERSGDVRGFEPAAAAKGPPTQQGPELLPISEMPFPPPPPPPESRRGRRRRGSQEPDVLAPTQEPGPPSIRTTIFGGGDRDR